MVCDQIPKSASTSTSSSRNAPRTACDYCLQSPPPCQAGVFNSFYGFKVTYDAVPSNRRQCSDCHHRAVYASTTQLPSERKHEVRMTTKEEFEEFFGGSLSYNTTGQEEKPSPKYEECPFDAFFGGLVNARSFVNCSVSDLRIEAGRSQPAFYVATSDCDAKASSRVAWLDTESPRSAEWNESLVSSSAVQ
mmetsp:Transcript_35533/g.83566  ORF Transcript_35533/g.83566 Transcript_35533/m.83566 type:complete len:191 (+) Transcript_35533:114-686(+)|eukprot:3687384-Rhodomonas_salina.1